MNARIALEPIGTVSAGISDDSSHHPPPRPAAAPVRAEGTADKGAPPPEATASAPPPLPELAASGIAFAAAAISGALAPRPVALKEVLLRSGSVWVPPHSDYRLADKKI